MQKQTYSCGNDPQPGDVVEVVTMGDLPQFEETNWAKEDLKLYFNYTVEEARVYDSCNGKKEFGVYLSGCKYIHPASRFRLIRRAGEQPQPDIVKLIEEKEREIEMLKKLIPRPIITGEKCFTVAYMRDTLGLLDKEEITYSRFVELLNERVEVYKDEAIRELVVSLNDIIMQHVTANFKTKEDQSEYNASLRRARLLITKYSKK